MRGKAALLAEVDEIDLVGLVEDLYALVQAVGELSPARQQPTASWRTTGSPTTTGPNRHRVMWDDTGDGVERRHEPARRRARSHRQDALVESHGSPQLTTAGPLRAASTRTPFRPALPMRVAFMPLLMGPSPQVTSSM
jgi:hypothetical protein